MVVKRAVEMPNLLKASIAFSRWPSVAFGVLRHNSMGLCFEFIMVGIQYTVYIRYKTNSKSEDYSC